MKTRLGKITSLTVLTSLFLVFALVWVLPKTPAKASGEKYPARTFVIPFNGESYKTIVIQNRKNANMVHGTSGASASDTAWNDAEIAGTQHAISHDWLFSIPAHDVDLCYMKGYDVAPASIDKTTIPDDGPWLYDPKNGMCFSDVNPIADNSVKTTTVQ